MTLASRSDSFDGTITDNSSIDDCKDVTNYSLPLGHLNDIRLTKDEDTLVELFGRQNNGYAHTVITGSPNSKVGDEFFLNVQGREVNVNITHTSQGVPEDCEEKKEQLNSQDPTPCKSISISDRLKQFLKDKPTQFWLAGVLLALMIISSIVLFFCLYKFNEGAPVGPPTFGHGDDLGDGIQVINREEWLARAPRHIKKLKGPLKMVRIMHTAGAFCKDYQKCASQVQTLQGWQVSQFDMPDIAYNYLIGGDGNVYVGRGPEVENQWQKNAYDIVYLGNYLGPYDQLSDKMETAGKRIIARLRNEGYLTPDYIVIAQNQTFNTLSPGENIFKKIVKWPHYDPGPHFNETET